MKKPAKTTTVHVAAAAHPSGAHPATPAPEPSPLTDSATATGTAATAVSPSTYASFADRIAAAVAAVGQIKSLLALDHATLSSKEIKRAVRFRKGGEPHVPTLANLSARYGVEVPARPTADMTASLELAMQLDPLRVALGELSKIVDDTYFGSRSDSWSTAMALYSMLKKGSGADPALASALQPLQDFFAYRHPTVAAQHPKRSLTKATDTQQRKVERKIAKLETQIATLRSAAPGTPPVTAAAASPATTTSRA